MTTAPLPLDAPPAVAHDRFPVIVRDLAGGLELRTARVVLGVPVVEGGPARLLVWSRPGDPDLDREVDLTRSLITHPRADWRLVTPQGDIVVRAGRGCGCGNALKSWVPFSPYAMGRLP